MKKLWPIEASVRTDQGQVRDHNEDFVDYIEPQDAGEHGQDAWLVIVADGVGGSDAGEIASRVATEQTRHHYLTSNNQMEPGQRLLGAIQSANADLRHLIATKEHGSRMATTMVAVVIKDQQAVIANVGDSRGYHWQNGALKQITKDHSLVARLVEEGVITEQEAENHPRKNVILHSLGPEDPAHVDLFELTLVRGEQLILCSDGLTRHVSDDEIAHAVSDMAPVEATEALIKLANKRGGEDNISVAVLRVGEQSDEKALIEELEYSPGEILATQERVAEGVAQPWIYLALLAAVQLTLVILIRYLFAG